MWSSIPPYIHDKFKGHAFVGPLRKDPQKYAEDEDFAKRHVPLRHIYTSIIARVRSKEYQSNHPNI